MNEKKLIGLLNELSQSRYQEGVADQIGAHGLAADCGKLANEIESLILGLSE